MIGTNQILAEIRDRGYKGAERTLRRWLISIRGRNTPAPVPPAPPPTRDITGWIMRPIDNLTDEHQAELERLCGLCPDLAAIRDLALARARSASEARYPAAPSKTSGRSR
ncbi:hypothetical protein ACTMTJ_41020 [Phytohabitans sp. LJ34]|uniref:hypothetical protein n=1 Tax=Phytohabitans sp. LJ34 TaxID=3452217 RepID=UPI003F8A52BF